MKKYTLKLTAAVVVAGAIARAGSTVDLAEADAKDLLRRGKATLVDGIDAPADRDAEAVDLHKLNKDQLVDVAQQLGLVSVTGSMTKAEIMEAIEAAAADQKE